MRAAARALLTDPVGAPRAPARPVVAAPPKPEPARKPAPHPNVGLRDANLSSWFSNERGELFEGFPIAETDVVLDVGCGDGGNSLFCARRGAHVTFADIQQESVEKVSREFQKHDLPHTALVTDVNPIQLPDGFADRIIATEVMEHVDDPAAFLRELVRVGKPGALYLISVPDVLGENIQSQLAPPAYFEKPNHIHIFSRTEFDRLISESGLKVELKRYYGFYHTMWWTLFWGSEEKTFDPKRPSLIESWERMWARILSSRDGAKIKAALDQTLPKSQAVVARKVA